MAQSQSFSIGDLVSRVHTLFSLNEVESIRILIDEGLQFSSGPAFEVALYASALLGERSSIPILRSRLSEVTNSLIWHIIFGCLVNLELEIDFNEDSVERRSDCVSTGEWFHLADFNNEDFKNQLRFVSSYEQFAVKFARNGTPCIITEDLAWPALEKWKRCNFLELYGHEVVQWRGDGVKTSIKEYIDGFKQPGNRYIMGPWINSSLDVSNDYKLPAVFSFDDWLPLPSGLHFFTGPATSGLDLHSHSSSINYLVYGIKLWFIWPPAFNWFRATRFRNIVEVKASAISQLPVAPIMATQFSGEGLYIPSGWVHAVYNITPCIGLVSHMYRNRPCEESIGLTFSSPESVSG
jgi:hypothetical protein